jgi:hypothetical protein
MAPKNMNPAALGARTGLGKTSSFSGDDRPRDTPRLFGIQDIFNDRVGDDPVSCFLVRACFPPVIRTELAEEMLASISTLDLDRISIAASRAWAEEAACARLIDVALAAVDRRRK